MTVFIHASLKLNEIKKNENLISFCKTTIVLFAFCSYDQSRHHKKAQKMLFYA